MKAETIMVTGSEGFIGVNLVRYLMEIGKKVVPIDLKSGDDLSKKKVFRGLPNVDAIIHLAGKTYVPSGWTDPHLMYDININTILTVLEFARRREVQKVIFPSSYVYGKPQYLPVDEKHPIDVSNPYSRSKLICEELCEAYSEDFDIPIVILRLFNVYGPGQSRLFLISRIISQLSTDNITVNDGAPKRDFVHISDVVRCLQCSIDFKDSRFEVFNIGSGISYKVSEVIGLILKISGAKCNIVYTNESRKSDIANTVADISKAEKLLKWEPRVMFEEGLRDMIVGEMRPRGLE